MSKCDGCGKRNFRPAPMLRDEVWTALADKHETLCEQCMWRRQRERHVSITINSLQPCPVNLIAWFDLFAQLVNAPPDNIAEWREFATNPWVLSRTAGQLHPWLIEPAEARRRRKLFAFRLDFLEKKRKRVEGAS